MTTFESKPTLAETIARLQEAAPLMEHFGLASDPEYNALRHAVRHLERLQRIDEAEERYAKRAANSTAADCIGWIREQKKKVPPNLDLYSRLMHSFYDSIIAHLEELHGRRAAADKYWEAKKQKEENDRKREHEEALNRARSTFEDVFGKWNREYGADAAWDAFKASAGRARHRREGTFTWDENPETPSPPGKKRPWYEVLEVSPKATEAEIKKAARRLRAKFHPDRYKEADAHDRMVEINIAYDEATR